MCLPPPPLPCQAVVNRYGAWEVDDAPPVSVQVQELPAGSSAAAPAAAAAAAAADGGGARGSSFQIKVTDWGNGIPPTQFANMFNYFFTTAKPASSL